jgi:murein DD-endopeptidase MepM/ murein hydrolase activator NlpD
VTNRIPSLPAKIGSLVLCLLPLVPASLAAPAATASRWTVRYQPARLVNGSPVLFQVKTPKAVQTLTGSWLGHGVSFSFDAEHKLWYGIAGASVESKPGAYPLQLRAETASGQSLTYTQTIRLLHRSYPRVKLSVPSRYTAPSAEDQRKIQDDKKIKDEIFKTTSPDRAWQGNFQPPVKAEISDVFGVQRVFNGAVQSTHQGLDYRAHTGTPVNAVNRGTVILARSLFFEGNCVVIDHGQGLLTLYLHLSYIGIKEGEQVGKGQQIGLSGGTGRATGPHLHLAVRWQGVYLDPAALLALRVP